MSKHRGREEKLLADGLSTGCARHLGHAPLRQVHEGAEPEYPPVWYCQYATAAIKPLLNFVMGNYNFTIYL